MLYLIEILHQTTTPIAAATGSPVLYLIEILHQTTTYIREAETLRRCILSKFYIKPQLRHDRSKKAHVVSYRNSTSNHNWKSFIVCNLVLYLIEILHQTTTFGDALKSAGKLYLIEILHQTTTLDAQSCLVERCILSKFYIKPQPRAHVLDTRTVVSYRNSTSNHNSVLHSFSSLSLYLIEILHQTTTLPDEFRPRLSLYLIEILHQTTTSSARTARLNGCILSKFYIKPQRRASY